MKERAETRTAKFAQSVQPRKHLQTAAVSHTQQLGPVEIVLVHRLVLVLDLLRKP